jgi:ParB family chromosome partitioning protein
MQTKTEPEMRLLATSMLVPNPQQPRRTFDRDALLGLGSSMKESGQVHPLIVDDAGNGTYIVVDGERRWRAAELVGITELMAIIRQLGEQNADTRHLIEALVTSTQREELSPVEFARACGKLKSDGAIQPRYL